MKQQTRKKMTISMNRKIDERKKYEICGRRQINETIKRKMTNWQGKKVKMSRIDSFQVKNK